MTHLPVMGSHPNPNQSPDHGEAQLREAAHPEGSTVQQRSPKCRKVAVRTIGTKRLATILVFHFLTLLSALYNEAAFSEKV